MMDAVTLRRYRIDDAAAVNCLFREVYGDHYVQPHVYLPWMISQNHREGRWHSLVALMSDKICGHATLFRQAASHSLTAELALSVVHPETRGQNIATLLGQQLLIHAQALGCRGVTIKQVTQHPYTQRMAAGLGFHSCGLLPDYVATPFGGPGRETIIVGHCCIDGYRRPLPKLVWPEACRELMLHLETAFGTTDNAAPWKGPKVHFEYASGRYDMVLKALEDDLFQQLDQLPAQWLISLRLRLAEGFASALHKLAAVGFIFTGIAPDDRTEGWLALFHRGYQQPALTLHCSHMQRLQEQIRQTREIKPQ